MGNINFGVLFLLSSFLFSCQAKQNNESAKPEGYNTSEGKLVVEENGLYKEVMAVHDEVMPLMSEIMALNKKLKEKAANLNNTQEKAEVQEMSSDLEAANEGMMNWMRKFNPNLENMTHQETMDYLRAEKEKIEKVREDMLLAQKSADLYLQGQE